MICNLHTNFPLRVVYFNAAKCALDLNYTGLQQSYESVGKIIDNQYAISFW